MNPPVTGRFFFFLSNFVVLIIIRLKGQSTCTLLCICIPHHTQNQITHIQARITRCANSAAPQSWVEGRGDCVLLKGNLTALWKQSSISPAFCPEWDLSQDPSASQPEPIHLPPPLLYSKLAVASFARTPTEDGKMRMSPKARWL